MEFSFCKLLAIFNFFVINAITDFSENTWETRYVDDIELLKGITEIVPSSCSLINFHVKHIFVKRAYFRNVFIHFAVHENVVLNEKECA